MKILNKKLIAASIFIFTLILLFSTIAYAKPFTEAFRGGLIQINDFFVNEQYKPYAAAIDFFFFAFLFISIYMMGARYAFKEVKRAETVIVILLGLMTAFLLVLGGFSATILLPYISWLLYVLLFTLYWWLLKGIKNKFWRFILALLLTLLTIGLIQGLFGAFTAPDTEGFFTSFSKSLGTIKFPEIGVPGVPPDLAGLFGVAPTTTGPSTLPTTTTPTVERVPPKAEEKPFTIFGLPWWMWLIILAILAIVISQRRRIGDLFKGGPPEERTPPGGTPPEELTEEQRLQKIIEEINKIIELKQKILKSIREILDRKKKLTKDLLDVYHKLINDPNFDPAFLLDKESEQYKNLMRENRAVAELLILEVQLEEDLIKLREIEEELSGTNLKEGKLVEWSGFISDYYKVRYSLLTKRLRQENATAPPEWYMQALGKMSAAFKNLIYGNEGVVPEIKEIIARFFLLAKRQEEVEKVLKKLTNFNNLKGWLREGRYEKWKAIQDKEANELKEYFEQEEKAFFDGELKPKVNLEMRYLQLIVQIIKFLESERKSFTQLQDLKIGVVDPTDHTKWIEVTEQATDPNIGIPQGTPTKVYTRLAEGLLPIKCGCYVDGVKIGEKDVTTEKYELIEFELTQLNLQPIEHTIIFVAISAKGTYVRRDAKTIIIYINPRIGPIAPMQVTPTPAAPVATPTTPTTSPYVHTPPTSAAPQVTPKQGIRINLLPKERAAAISRQPIQQGIRINLLPHVREERTLLKWISSNLKKIKEKIPSRKRREIEEVERAAEEAAAELEEFEKKRIVDKFDERLKKINRKVQAIVRLIILKLKGIKYMAGAAAELEQLEEERLRALGEAAEAPIEEAEGGLPETPAPQTTPPPTQPVIQPSTKSPIAQTAEEMAAIAERLRRSARTPKEKKDIDNLLGI